MTQDRIIDRIRKLLELSHSTNEHEAAQAAARAAEMMSMHAVTEAMLEVVSDDDAAQAGVRERERIVEQGLPDDTERRVAWRDRIANSLARSLECEVLYWNGKLQAIGRESNVQTWQYTAQYLFSEVARLADEAWLQDGEDLAAVGQRPRAWKGSFRLGAADVIANRLYEQHRDRKASEQARAKELAAASEGGENEQLALVRVDAALAIIERDRAAVKAVHAKRTEGWSNTRSIGNSARMRSGYMAGREAGKAVNLSGSKRSLKSG